MSQVDQSNEILAIRCQLGELEAWNALVERWHPRLWRFLSSMLPNRTEAEDALQIVWLRAVQSFARLRDPSRVGPWLFSIARFTVLDRLREQYSRPPHEEMNEVPEDDRLPQEIDWSDEIQAGLSSLGPADREAIVLHYLEGLSVAQVAEICQVAVGTVKSRLHRARRILRQSMSKGANE